LSEPGSEDLLSAEEVWVECGSEDEGEEGWEDAAGMADPDEVPVEVGGWSSPSPHSESGAEDGVAEAARLAAEEVWVP
jgi:hypothetical protein